MDDERSTACEENSQSSSEDEVPLAKFKALRSQIAFKRNQRNSAKQLKETTGKENVDENEYQSEIESLLDDSESDFIDNSDVDPDYVPTTPKKKEKAFALPRRRKVSGKSTGTPRKLALSPNDQLQIPSTSTQSPQNDTPLSGEQTENNTLRKRRKRRHTKEIIRDEATKKAKSKAKHVVRKGCDGQCKKKCSEHFSEEERKAINDLFWTEDWVEQKKFIQRHVVKGECARRVSKATKIVKKHTFKFSLRTAEGEYKNVCKQFFLTTLGFSRNNDSAVRTVMAFQLKLKDQPHQ